MVGRDMDAIVKQLDPERPVLIAGPTASGKSALALAIAARSGGIVVNADALQVFANWRVLTARPSAQEEAVAPHALYGHVARDHAFPAIERGASIFQRPGHALDIFRPLRMASTHHLIERKFHVITIVDGFDKDVAILTRAQCQIDRAVDRHGQDESGVVVRVLADQIYAPWSAHNVGGFSLETLLEVFLKTVA